MERNTYILTKSSVIFLMRYYLVLLFIGILATCLALTYEGYSTYITITTVSIVGGFGSAILGSTIFYLRKLYKANINEKIIFPSSDAERNKEIGVRAYFFLRPIFAVVFSLLIHILLKYGVHIITVKETRLDEGLIYTSMFLSFFAGFSSGDFITYMEKKGQNLVSSIFKNN